MRLIQHCFLLFTFFLFSSFFSLSFFFLANISSLSLTYEFPSTSLGGILIERSCYFGGWLYELPCDRVWNGWRRQQPASRRSRLYAWYQRREVPRTAACDAGFTVSYFFFLFLSIFQSGLALALHSVSLSTPLSLRFLRVRAAWTSGQPVSVPSIPICCLHVFLPMFCPFYLSSCRWGPCLFSPPFRLSLFFLRIMVSVLRPDSYDIFWTVLIPGDRTWISHELWGLWLSHSLL